jgi:hypothetical protein
MKFAKLTSSRVVRWLALAVVGTLLSPKAQAQWGSIRANNRDHAEHVEHHEVEHAQPEHREPEHRAPENERVIHESRHYDVDADRHRGYYWWGVHPGIVVGALPAGYLTFNFGGRPYYYYEGVYYQPGGSGYAVVAPPAGVIVPVLPPGAEAAVVNGAVFYYAGGVFYIQQPNGYAVVAPPLGATVSSLPPGAAPVTVRGMVYYLANNVYYLPVMQNGVTMYMTAQP